MAEPTLVAVTGASGYIALHVIRQLLEAGHAVRGTVRDGARGARVRASLDKHCDTAGLSFAEANLAGDAGWAEAMAGCDYLIHMASPLPLRAPKDENELILPARDGALRALGAAADAGIRRVVMTSSIAAVSYGHGDAGPHDERRWSDTSADIGAYPKSKTLAEKAAWEFVASLAPERQLELVCINPGLVIGPLLDPDGSASVEVVRKLLAREVPGTANIGFSLIDVRDVAQAHVRALTADDVAGNRYICTGPFVWLADLAAILSDHVAGRGYRVPTRKLPDWVVRLVALFDPTVRLVVDDLGRRTEFDTARIRQALDWSSRPIEDSIRETADSLIDLGVV